MEIPEHWISIHFHCRGGILLSRELQLRDDNVLISRDLNKNVRSSLSAENLFSLLCDVFAIGWESNVVFDQQTVSFQFINCFYCEFFKD